MNVGVEELCSAVLVSLNLSGITSPDQRLQAQRWLEAATSSTEIFPAALAILGEGFSAPQAGLTNAIQHVIATMLVKRIRDSSMENKQALAGSLVPGLLECISGWVCKDPLSSRRSGIPPPYIAQVARALAGVALASTGSGANSVGSLEWTIASVLGLSGDLGQCWGTLIVIEAMAAEARRESTDESSRLALLQTAPAVLSYIEACLQSLSSATQQEQISTIVRATLATLQEWGGIGLTLQQIQKCGGLLGILCQAFTDTTDPDVAEVFIDMIESFSSGCTKDDDWIETMKNLAQVLVMKRAFLVQPDEHILRCLYRGAACIAVGARSWVAGQSQGGDPLVGNLIGLLVEGSSSQNIRTAGLCIEVWPQLLKTPARHRSYDLQGPLFDQLIPMLLPQAMFPGEEAEEDTEEWMVFREQILAEALHVCYLETHVDYLKLLTERLRNSLNLELNPDPEPWRSVEATLFSMRCVSYAVQKRALLSIAAPSALNTASRAGITAQQESVEDLKKDAIATSEVLGTFLELVIQEDPPSGPIVHPQALSAAVHCLSQFAQFMAKVAPDAFIDRVLNFLVSALAMNRAAWTHGTQAVRNLTSRAASRLAARPNILPTLLQVWSQVVPTDMEAEERCTLAQGICRVIAAVETENPTTLEAPITELAVPILNKMQELVQTTNNISTKSSVLSSHLKALATILRSLARCSGACGTCLKVVSEAWTTLTVVIDFAATDDGTANAVSELLGRILGLLQVSGSMDLGQVRQVLQSSEPLVAQSKLPSVLGLVEEVAETLGPMADKDLLQQAQHSQDGMCPAEGSLSQILVAYIDFVFGAALPASPDAPAPELDLRVSLMTTAQRLVASCPITFVGASQSCGSLLALASADLAAPADLSVQTLLFLTIFSNLPDMVGALSMEQHLRPTGSNERWSYIQTKFNNFNAQYFQSFHQSLLLAILGNAPEGLLDALANLIFDIFRQHFEHSKNVFSSLLWSDAISSSFPNAQKLSSIQSSFHKNFFNQASLIFDRDQFCSFIQDIWRVCSGIANVDILQRY